MAHEMRKLMEAAEQLTEWDLPRRLDYEGFLPISCEENGFWFEQFDEVDDGGGCWFDGIGESQYDLGSEKFNNKFDNLEWENYYFTPDADWESVVSTMPDPVKFGIDPSSTQNTDVEAGRLYLDAFVDWFESQEKADNIKHIDDLDDSPDGEPNDYEPTDDEIIDAQSHWENRYDSKYD
jgi:hypothetical protein